AGQCVIGAVCLREAVQKQYRPTSGRALLGEVEGEAADLHAPPAPAGCHDAVTLGVGHEHFLAAATDCSRATAQSTIRHARSGSKGELRTKKILSNLNANLSMSVSRGFNGEYHDLFTGI